VNFPAVHLVPALVLELVVLRRHGDGRILLRLLFGLEVLGNYVLLNRVVALEAQSVVGNPAQRGNVPQGMQPSLLLQLGNGPGDLHFHRGALHCLCLPQRRGAVILNDHVGRRRNDLCE